MSKRRRKKTKNNENKNRLFGAAALLIICVGAFMGMMRNTPFEGGWEINDSLSLLTVNSETIDIQGLHETRMDPDDETSGAPDIVVQTGYPYYVRNVDGDWVKTNEPAIIDVYNRTYMDANWTHHNIIYTLYCIAFDTSVQTDADSWYIDWPALDYGYHFEADEADVNWRVSFQISPWTPSGIEGSWQLVGGWAGIMSASIMGIDYGLMEASAEENYGHTITNLHSRGAALNMFVNEQSESSRSFNDPDAIKDVPSTVDIEFRATLAAGAYYTTDWAGHAISLAVRNVFVEYSARVSVVTVRDYVPIIGLEDEMEPPPENNTAYAPVLTPLDALLAGLQEFWRSPSTVLLLMLALIGIIVVFWVCIRR